MGSTPTPQPAALFRDRQRANDFTLANVDVIRFTWSDSHCPTYVAGVVRRGLVRDTATKGSWAYVSSIPACRCR